MLEQIVRPFADPNALATTRIVAKNLSPAFQRARLLWGATGQVPTPTEEQPGAGLSFKCECCKDGYGENTRKTSMKRVENPDDPSQYVMVEAIDEIGFDVTKQGCADGSDPVVARAFAQIDAEIAAAFPVIDLTGKDCKATFSLKNQQAA